MAVWRGVVTITHPSLGGTGTNTWHVRSSEAPGPQTEIDVDTMSGVIKQFYLDIQFIFPTGTILRQSGEWQGVGDDEGSFTGTTEWAVAGTATSGPLPPANCIVVNWRGQSGDRSRKGRTFLGPIATSLLEADGTVTSPQLVDIRTAADTLRESSDSAANGAVGVWSRQESVFRDVVATSVNDQFAVLRSRRD